MSLRTTLVAAACCLAACQQTAPGGASLGDPCNLSSDCADPYICVSGVCTPSAGQLCTATTLRCNGNDVEQCTPAGDAWVVQTTCAIGCVGGACVAPVCSPGAQQCMDGSINECLSDGSKWVPVQVCPTTCIPNPANANLAECSEPVCTPFETACVPDMAGQLQTCTSNGTGWTTTACSTDPSAPAACLNGQCQPVICSAGQQACNGDVPVECNASGTAFDAAPSGPCANGCVYDADAGMATCPPAVCIPLTSTCNADGVTLETCNAYGTGVTSKTCAVSSGPAVCANGTCQSQVCNVVSSGGTITSRDEQCSGSILQECNNTETGWQDVQTCPYGCGSVGTNGAQCNAPACQPTQGQCVGEPGQLGAALELCTPDQTTFAFVQFCPSGCTVDTTQTPPQASCNPPVCDPLSRMCGVDPTTNGPAVELCQSDGTGYVEVEQCAQECVGGTCIVSASSCTPGDLQCQGAEVQQCILLDGAPAWQFVEYCLSSCVSGACTAGGSCGCDPIPSPSTAADECGGGGTGAPSPVTLNLLAGGEGTVATGADGGTAAVGLPCGDTASRSSVLVYTSPITSADGTPVPDGTMVTFVNDFPLVGVTADGGTPSDAGQIYADSLIASQDADPSLPGIQRPTLNGVAVAVLYAPTQANCVSVDPSTGAVTTGARTVTVTAAIAGACEGSLPIYFTEATAASESAGRTVYYADDFSNPSVSDPVNTPTPAATWNAQLGALEAIPSFSLGSGVDGDLTVPTGATLDLQAEGYAPEWDVLAITAQGAQVNDATPSLAPGNEVLLITLWGPAASLGPGTYEFHHVASVDDSGGFGNVIFTEPVLDIFGNGSNDDLGGHRVVLQKVPQFVNVTVPYGTTLTSTAVSVASGCTTACTPVGGTGVLAFRAQGTVSISGQVSMDQAGLPENLSYYPATASTSSLNRLLLGDPAVLSGPAGANSGGGIIFFTGGLVEFPNTAGGPIVSAVVHANIGTGGGAGVVWVAGPNLQFNGETRLQATGGSAGRTRVDYSVADFTANSTPPPMAATQSTFIGENGGLFAQSTTVPAGYRDPAFTASSGTLYGLIGGSDVTSIAVPPPPTGFTELIPGLDLWVSSDGGATWALADSGSFTFGSGPAAAGNDIRYRVELAPPTDQTLLLRGMAVSIQMGQ